MSISLKPTRYPYVFRRGAFYYFRKTPPPRQVTDKQCDICISLQTSDIHRARLIALRLELLMSQSLRDDPTLSNPEVRELVRKLARLVFKHCLIVANEDALNLQKQGELEDFKAEIKNYKDTIKEVNRTLNTPDKCDPSYISWASDLLGEHMPDTWEPEVHQSLVSMIQRARLESARVFLARIAGDFENLRIKDPLFEDMDIDMIQPTFGTKYTTTSTAAALPFRSCAFTC